MPICAQCQKEFDIVWPATRSKYCSSDCWRIGYRNENRRRLVQKSTQWAKNNRLRRLEIQRKWNNSPQGLAYKQRWHEKRKKLRTKRFLEQYHSSVELRSTLRARNKSRKILLRSGRKRECSRCQTTSKLHCHHKDENPFNMELSNLEWLCPSCHAFVHSEHGRIEKGIVGGSV